MPVTAANAFTMQRLQRMQQFQRGNWLSRAADAAVFFTGLVSFYALNVIGSLPGDEILLAILLPAILILRGRRAFRPEYRLLYLLLAGWLLGTMISDLWNGMPLENSIKGIARVVFFTIDFIGLAVLVNHSLRRIIIFTLGAALSQLIYMRQFADHGMLWEWKFGGSLGVTCLALLVACYFVYRRRYVPYILIVIGLAALNLKFAYRSQIAIDFISVIVALPVFLSRRGTKPSSGRRVARICFLLGCAGLAAYLAHSAIQFAVDNGYFTTETRDKFEQQAQGKLGVLFGGRPEILVSLIAIRDRPILGHGSFAIDPKYLYMLQDFEYQYGYSEYDEPSKVALQQIPTHSHITLAWVESGILGGIFWIYVLVLVFRVAARLAEIRPLLLPLYSYFFVNFVWDIFFSPFGLTARVWAAFYIVIAMNLLYPPVSKPLPQPRGARLRGPMRVRLIPHRSH